MLRYLIYLLFSLTALIADVSNKNNLSKPLKLSTTIFNGLLTLDPKEEGFVPVPFRESIRANFSAPTKEVFYEDEGVLLAEKIFNQFSQNLKTSSHYSIPPIVHLIWLGSNPPPTVDLAIASWKKYHPNWEIKLWSDEEIINFQWSCPRSEFFFKQANNWAEKSDILRFEILYQFGGIYSDTDVICLKSFEDLLLKDITFFACIEENRIVREFGRPIIGSAIIGAAKNHPIIKRCMDFSQTKQEAPKLFQHLRSGPGPLSKASFEALQSGQKDILILPCSYFYPLPWTKRLAPLDEIIKNIKPESFAIHLWEGSWFEP